jgi:hypothetical protein
LGRGPVGRELPASKATPRNLRYYFLAVSSELRKEGTFTGGKTNYRFRPKAALQHCAKSKSAHLRRRLGPFRHLSRPGHRRRRLFQFASVGLRRLYGSRYDDRAAGRHRTSGQTSSNQVAGRSGRVRSLLIDERPALGQSWPARGRLRPGARLQARCKSPEFAKTRRSSKLSSWESFLANPGVAQGLRVEKCG